MAAGEPLTIDKMLALFAEDKEPPTRDAIKEAINLIEQDCENRGIELKKVSSGYRFQAKKDFSPWVSRLWEEKPARYSRALLETLVLIAYKQPITRGEVEQVRGVAVSTNIIKTLLERDWVKVVGHREVPGRPALYATTKAFLDYFNLTSLEQLPTLAEIRDLAKINPELDLLEAGLESLPESAGDTGEIEDVSAEEVAEMNANEASEEEIDVNIEDTDNIRGTVESEIESENETDIESVTDSDTDSDNDASTDTIVDSITDYTIDSSETEEDFEEDAIDDDYLDGEDQFEAVAVSEDIDEEYTEADEVDSKFAG